MRVELTTRHLRAAEMMHLRFLPLCIKLKTFRNYVHFRKLVYENRTSGPIGPVAEATTPRADVFPNKTLINMHFTALRYLHKTLAF